MRWVRWLPWLLLGTWTAGNLVVVSSRGGAWLPWDLLIAFACTGALIAYAVFAIACPTWKRWATIAVISASWWLVWHGAGEFRSWLLHRTRSNGTEVAEAVVRYQKRTGILPDTLSALLRDELPAGIPQPWLLGEAWDYHVVDSKFDLFVWVGGRQALSIGPDLVWSRGGDW